MIDLNQNCIEYLPFKYLLYQKFKAIYNNLLYNFINKNDKHKPRHNKDINKLR